MKNITILGSTGSIGLSTIDVIRLYPDRFRVIALAAGSNIDILEEQIRLLKPSVAGVFDKDAADRLRSRVDIDVLSGQEGIRKIASLSEADIVVSAIVGSDGLIPTLEAIKAGKDIALANKEALVMAGSIITKEVSNNGVRILPVDSEHSALFQCLDGRSKAEIKQVVLTASGGPFSGMGYEDLLKVTPEDALRHPNWRMGKKITIDSATLMNKGLEVIEAHWLFGLPKEMIKVIIHPQSIIHSMVEFIDGSLLSQLSVPDMRGPIAYALSYPERLCGVLSTLNLSEIKQLTFAEPDTKNFPCLSYAYDALDAGGTMPAVMNAANEVAVYAFLDSRIAFTDISAIVNETMDSHTTTISNNIEDILYYDQWARHRASEAVVRLSR